MGCEVRGLPYKDISWEMLLESVLRLEKAHTCVHAHTHTRFNTYSTIQTGGRVGLGTRRFAPTFFPEAHASWWQFKTLYLRSLIFFPKSKTLLGWHLLHMQPGGNESCKNENQAISYRAWEGQGRGTWLLRLAMFSLRVPSASSNSASDWLIPAPLGVVLDIQNQ